MGSYQAILDKINQFIRKYYINELIRGSILFVALGLLYFIATLYIEYFLWLNPTMRTILFVLFVAVELFLLYRYILTPVFKLIGLRKGLDHCQASTIIGNFFPDIDDKLLNTLQLHEQHANSDLVLASVEQKAQNLKIFPFKKAVNFKVNLKYLKFLAIPVVIYLLSLITGLNKGLSQSYTRLTHPQVAYVPPAPFSFEILNNELKVIEGQNFTLQLHINGATVPDEVLMIDNGQQFYMQKQSLSDFTYTFKNVKEAHEIALYADPVRLEKLKLEVIPTPKIQNLELLLQYPSYTGKKSQTLKNTGNAIVPEGTRVTWQVYTQAVDSLFFVSQDKRLAFQSSDKGFTKSLQVRQAMAYALTASNAHLKDYERLNFNFSVIKDELPKMIIRTDIDSIPYGDVHFAGRVSDDYGITKLQLVYFKTNHPEAKQYHNIGIASAQISDFLLTFPGDLTLEQAQDYSLYFEVFDNDAVNGHKSVKSQVFNYYKPSANEREQQLLEEQQKQLQSINHYIKKQAANQDALDQLEQQLKNTPNIDYNTEEQLKDAIRKQDKYQEMMQNKLRDLNEQFKDRDLNDDLLKEKQQDIEERLEEMLDNKKDEELLEELQKLAEKLDKEDLIKKMEQMSSRSKYKEKSLKELLELTKRFYVEQQLQKTSEDLKELSEKQESLKNNSSNSLQQQKELSEEFKNIQQNIGSMSKANESLQKPMPIDPQKAEQQQINKHQQQAEQDLQQGQQNKAKSQQSKASSQMKQMSQSFAQMLESIQSKTLDEDIESIKRLLDNLLIFSFKQEDLLMKFNASTTKDFNFSDNLKEQYRLQSYFEHIDDSLYTLAMRQPKLSKNINTYLEDAHYNLKTSIKTMEDNQLGVSKAHQQYVMTAANDIAYLLNALLDNLSNASLSNSSSGDPQQGMGFSLPDIIQKQSALNQQMQHKMEKGKPSDKEGKEGQSSKAKSEGQSGELYEIYKQQAQIKQELEQQLKDLKGSALEKTTQDLIRKMEQLENILLDKGITQNALKRMTAFEQELLKLKEAAYTQHQDNQRQSKSNEKTYNSTSSKLYKKFLEDVSKQEILNRTPLPFQSEFNARINKYFKTQSE
ncbi:MAG: hypothetical protein CSA40_01245 [Flavobacteriales bacterium]|nr:MAG: hypothetical protein CSA40_01245 [Flavobacteriales bacterium]